MQPFLLSLPSPEQPMARRRPRKSPEVALIQVGAMATGMFFLLGSSYPPLLRGLFELGLFVLGIVLIVGIIFVAIAASRYIKRKDDEEAAAALGLTNSTGHSADYAQNSSPNSDEKYMPP